MKNARLLLKLSILFLCIFSVIATGFVIFPKPEKKLSIKVIFINQVRGVECCQKGSYENLKSQLDIFEKYHFPSTFVLRYDAILNSDYVSLLKSYSKSNHNLGVFFEITPGLAKNAGVEYKGNAKRWYRAQYAYLMGYSLDDRKKIIDTAMEAFKREFGYTPKITAGWMMDTYSANYLSQKYGVLAHEITREQWGTDGYALYGGSILSAYKPSRRWIFVPAKNEQDAMSMTIFRQTVSDPVRNYGDITSSYTSQPNDYGRQKTLSYFKHILRQVGGYSQPLAILGLENSIEPKYQKMYAEQISYINEVVDRQNIITPLNSVQIDRTGFVKGRDYYRKDVSSYWVQTPQYRVRLFVQNNKIALTDLRVYDETLIDPYATESVTEKTAFWDIPYVFDTSRNHVQAPLSTLDSIWGTILRYFGNSDWLNERVSPLLNEEFSSEINGIVLPSAKEGSLNMQKDSRGNISLDYVSNRNKHISLLFNSESISFNGVHKNDYSLKGPYGINADAKFVFSKDRMDLYPKLKESSIKASDVGHAEPQGKNEIDINSVQVIYNAPLSLLGRNPVRLILISKDKQGSPLPLSGIDISYQGGEFDSVVIDKAEGHLGDDTGMYYVDIQNNKPGTFTPILSIDGKKKTLKNITFVLNCKTNFTSCVSHPDRLFQYIIVKINDILNRR